MKCRNTVKQKYFTVVIYFYLFCAIFNVPAACTCHKGETLISTYLFHIEIYKRTFKTEKLLKHKYIYFHLQSNENCV